MDRPTRPDATPDRPIPPERWIVFEPWDYCMMREGACTYADPEADSADHASDGGDALRSEPTE